MMTQHTTATGDYGFVTEREGRALIDALLSVKDSENVPTEAETFATILREQLHKATEKTHLPEEMPHTVVVPVPVPEMTREGAANVVATVEGLARDIRENAPSLAARADAEDAIEGRTPLIGQVARTLHDDQYWRRDGFSFE